MTPLAVSLILLSSSLHASWNFLGKRQNPQAAFFLVASLSALFCLSPWLAIHGWALAFFPPGIWICILATGSFQAIYYIGLAGAYRNGNLSLAYPLARALPVLLVALVSLLLGRGHQIGWLALLGFVGVAAGCLILPLRRFGEARLVDYLNPCCLYAALAALGTTGYTLLDDEILRQLRQALGPFAGMSLGNQEITLLFLGLETISTLLVLGLFVLGFPPERHSLTAMSKTTWWNAVLSGLIITIAYGLVLLSMAYVQNVSYVAAFRQTSILIGASMGIFLRKEPSDPPKIFGLVLVMAGLILVALG